tara:strand:- start:290 stop:562 length:273 start_codon:yes stop_codon:yes gene_type:complete
MKKTIIATSRYNRDIKRLKKQNKDFKPFRNVIRKLESGIHIPTKYKPHRLKGKWSGYLECHVKPDWLLIWKETKTIIYLARTGSHSDLFE